MTKIVEIVDSQEKETTMRRSNLIVLGALIEEQCSCVNIFNQTDHTFVVHTGVVRGLSHVCHKIDHKC